jgi:hypothetical protein
VNDISDRSEAHNLCQALADSRAFCLKLIVDFACDGKLLSSCCSCQPRIPSDAASQPNFLLQEFAWTWREMLAKTAERRKLVVTGDVAPELAHAPMFNMHTAIKTLYWSSLIYHDMDSEQIPKSQPRSKVRTVVCAAYCAQFASDHASMALTWQAAHILHCVRSRSCLRLIRHCMNLGS